MLSILRGESSAQEAARRHGLTVAEVEEWKDRFLSGAENALRTRPKDEEALKDEQIRKLKQKVGELVLDLDILKEGNEGPPFCPQDVRRVKAAVPGTSERRICRVLRVSRSSVRPAEAAQKRTGAILHEHLADRIRLLIHEHPTWGYRLLWSWLRFREGTKVNRKTVYRILKLKRWFVHQRQKGPRPRAQGRGSRAERSNERWAMDVTHIACGADGWAHLAAVIDCHDRQIIGYEFSLRGRAKEAERALESACIERFGTLRPQGATPVIRSDNGLIFQSRRFREACRQYRLRQEYITPYAPEQNGMIERFFRSLKEECVWQHSFESFEQASRAVRAWIRFYNEERPHQALGYRSPAEYRAQQVLRVA